VPVGDFDGMHPKVYERKKI